MIEVVTNERLIKKCQTNFIQRLKSICEQKKISCKVGYKGSSDNVTAYYSSKYNFWFTTSESTNANNRYWNAFGIGKPNIGKSNSITVEINPPFEGINHRTGGVFGQTTKGEILILHRGKIGGGREGIGKQLFFDQIRGAEFVSANDDGIETDFYLIGSILSKHFPKQISDFIANVDRIKNEISIGDMPFSNLNKFEFTSEYFGKNKIERKGKTTINRVHGIVVNALAKELNDKGITVGNDCNRDLFIYKRKQIKTLFEIKASSSPQDLYTAVGQLLIYSIPIKNKISLVMVIPNPITKEVLTKLNEFGINVLYYSWNKDEPVFEGLNRYF